MSLEKRNGNQTYKYRSKPSPNQQGMDSGYKVTAEKGLLWTEPSGLTKLIDPLSNRDILGKNLQAADCRKLGLRCGDYVELEMKIPQSGLVRIDAAKLIDSYSIKDISLRPSFENLTPIYPHERIKLGRLDAPLSCRIIDKFIPIGWGARALIVAPPKAGKTTLLKDIVLTTSQEHPEAVIVACLIAERPEELTEFRRTIVPKGGTVFGASFDESSNQHIFLARLALERAKRAAEMGKNVLLVIDSLTRLARAHNNSDYSGGRTLSGGIDTQALDFGRRAFGVARSFEEGGSLTLLATCLKSTGSRLDDVVYEEFKGTGNVEIHLTRDLSDERIFPAIDLKNSGTRNEERLLSSSELAWATAIRRKVAGKPLQEQLETVIDSLLSN